MKNGGGHFAPELGGHFELESGGHFKLELGGQYHWNLHSRADTLFFVFKNCDGNCVIAPMFLILSYSEIKK